MEQKENTQQLTRASEYITKYKLKKAHNDFFGSTMYERTLHFKDKNVRVVLLQHELDENICYILKQAFYKNKYDKKWGCYGVFGKPHYIEKIINDIKDYEKQGETKQHEK